MTKLLAASDDQERYSRRLSDKIQAAFDHACDENELQVAGDLLEILEIVLLRTPPRPERREAVVAPLLAAHERLWHLRASSPQTSSARVPANASLAGSVFEED